jgi:pimeloyl-ACP methyl ester carboxylesterase
MVARDAWVSSGRFVDFGGAAARRVFLRESGASDGPALFFLHGFPTSSWDWSKLEPFLLKRYRLGYVDFLGFGASAKPARHRYSLLEQAQVARAALDALGFERVHLVAHDYGVSVAMQFLCEPALRARVASLTLLNDDLYAELHKPTPLEERLRSRAGPLLGRFTSRERFAGDLRSRFSARHQPAPGDLDQQWQALADEGGAHRMHRLMRYLDDRAEFGPMWESALEEADVPVNFIWGMLDPLAGAGTLAHAVPRMRRFPNVTTLPDVGHFPHIEVPARVATSLSAFVDSLPDAAAGRSAVLTSG